MKRIFVVLVVAILSTNVLAQPPLEITKHFAEPGTVLSVYPLLSTPTNDDVLEITVAVDKRLHVCGPSSPTRTNFCPFLTKCGIMSGSTRYEVILRFNEIPDWPPRWQPLISRSTELLEGEFGILKSAKPLMLDDKYLSVVIEHEGVQYAGLLRTGALLRDQILEVLQKLKGRPIEDIRDIDIEM